MFINKKQNLFFIFFLLFVFACNEKKSLTVLKPESMYSLFIMDKAGAEYMIETPDLSGEKIDPASHDIKSGIPGIDRELIVKDGYYYRLNSKTKKFVKYTNDKGRLKELGSTDLGFLFIENFCWINDDTLLLFGKNKDMSRGMSGYAKVDVSKMKEDKGELKLPVPDESDISSAIGFSLVKDNNLIVGYTYYQKDKEVYRASDTSYIAIFDYSEMKIRSVYKNTKSAHPGNENTVEPGSFRDEKGDFYFLTCPGIAMGNLPQKPTALYRINANDLTPDSSYFFNISSLIGNHAYSIYYIGDGKAIIRSERSDLYAKWDEHWKKPHFEFYLLDIVTQNAKKIDLPLDKGTRRQSVINDGDVVYISINSEAEGNFIWIYNKKTGKLKKGLQLTGDTDYILRVDKIL